MRHVCARHLPFQYVPFPFCQGETTPEKMSLKASKEITKCLPHVFHECSDLPPLPPLFSCSACDAWRVRMHSKGHGCMVWRDFLNDCHQCTRFKEGRPIKVRVVKAAAEANPRISSAATLAALEDKCNAFMELSANCRRSSRVKFKERERIIKSQSAQVNKSGKENNASGKNNNSLKSKRARETIARLEKRKEALEVAAIVCAQKSERALATEMMLKATSIESAARKKLLLITEKEAEIQQRNESI
jgi:hypothetical protein